MPARKPPKELTRFSGNKNSGRNRSIGLVTIHESVGVTDAWDLALFCERQGVSYHATADNEKIVYTVPRTDTAWHLRNGNPYADGLCLGTPKDGYSRDQWLGPQKAKVEFAAWWVAGVCTARGLKIERLSHDGIRSVLAGNWQRGGVIGHVDYTYATGDGSHTDPRNFPFDVCIAWAKGLTTNQEDDMANVPQNEWNEISDMVRKLWSQVQGPNEQGWENYTGDKKKYSVVDYARNVHNKTHVRLDLAGRPGGDLDDLLGHVLSTHAIAKGMDARLVEAARKWDEFIARNK